MGPNKPTTASKPTGLSSAPAVTAAAIATASGSQRSTTPRASAAGDLLPTNNVGADSGGVPPPAAATDTVGTNPPTDVGANSGGVPPPAAATDTVGTNPPTVGANASLNRQLENRVRGKPNPSPMSVSPAEGAQNLFATAMRDNNEKQASANVETKANEIEGTNKAITDVETKVDAIDKKVDEVGKKVDDGTSKIDGVVKEVNATSAGLAAALDKIKDKVDGGVVENLFAFNEFDTQQIAKGFVSILEILKTDEAEIDPDVLKNIHVTADGTLPNRGDLSEIMNKLPAAVRHVLVDFGKELAEPGDVNGPVADIKLAAKTFGSIAKLVQPEDIVEFSDFIKRVRTTQYGTLLGFMESMVEDGTILNDCCKAVEEKTNEKGETVVVIDSPLDQLMLAVEMNFADGGCKMPLTHIMESLREILLPARKGGYKDEDGEFYKVPTLLEEIASLVRHNFGTKMGPTRTLIQTFDAIDENGKALIKRVVVIEQKPQSSTQKALDKVVATQCKKKKLQDGKLVDLKENEKACTPSEFLSAIITTMANDAVTKKGFDQLKTEVKILEDQMKLQNKHYDPLVLGGMKKDLDAFKANGQIFEAFKTNKRAFEEVLAPVVSGLASVAESMTAVASAMNNKRSKRQRVQGGFVSPHGELASPSTLDN